MQPEGPSLATAARVGADILERIVASKDAEVAALRRNRRALTRAAAEAPPALPVLGPMAASPCVSVFAEVKRRSPGAGPIAPGLDPVALSAAYQAGGARAVSVLTDGPWFGGSLADLEAVARPRTVPVLRKDFVVDPLQVLEARAAGASLVLLVARILDPVLLADLRAMVHELGMAALVEAHDEREVDQSLKAGARMVGINNRDLASFETRLEVTERLSPRVPDDVLVVSESGIREAADVARAAAAGAAAVLVGEALVRSGDPAQAVAEMAAVPRRGVRSADRTTAAKVCGVTSPGDAATVADAGADYMGVILSPGYGRSVDLRRAQEVFRACDGAARPRRVGVFVNEEPRQVAETARALRLDVVQLHGRESSRTVAEVGAAGPWRVWKTVHAGPAGARLADEIAPYAGVADGVLVDAWDPTSPGGTGRAFPWDRVGDMVRRAAPEALFAAAGGMTPANAASAVRALAPDVLDTSSGVESAAGAEDSGLGAKDPAKVRAFVEAVRTAGRGTP